MGLDTSHDCWHGPYSAFGRWREAIAATIGIDLPQMKGFGGDQQWDLLSPDPLHVLLNHSDCDGDIPAKDCAPLADRLEAVLPKLPEETHPHGFQLATRRFIDGLRRAARKGEAVEFH